MQNAQNFAAVVSSMILGPFFFKRFSMLSKFLYFSRFFQILTDSMSSGMQNAQNFAAIISSMVLEPSFFDLFSCFPSFGFFYGPGYGLGRGLGPHGGPWSPWGVY